MTATNMNAAIRHEKNPNPQGKGLVPILQDLSALPALPGAPKTPSGFFTDYCVSSLVLAADFRFKPVVNKHYFLYSTAAGWNLSLVSPAEWRDKIPGEFVAQCKLCEDMTWRVDFDPQTGSTNVRQKLEVHAEGFINSFDCEGSVESTLPFYVAHLPYYRRVMATALASSLLRTMPMDVDLKQLALSLEPGSALLAPPVTESLD